DRKKGIPSTEEELRLFSLGLEVRQGILAEHLAQSCGFSFCQAECLLRTEIVHPLNSIHKVKTKLVFGYVPFYVCGGASGSGQERWCSFSRCCGRDAECKEHMLWDYPVDVPTDVGLVVLLALFSLRRELFAIFDVIAFLHSC
ncbi:hypothetical protein L7F22_040538, partial [Adiantum nelumboides]|nr:hypothetical protein [Adiantum nelumboides]